MSQNWTRGETICSGQAIADRRTDRQIDHYGAPAERGPNESRWITYVICPENGILFLTSPPFLKSKKINLKKKLPGIKKFPIVFFYFL